LGLLRLPGGATVPPAGPLRATPLTPPAVAFTSAATTATATATATTATTTTPVPSATTGAGLAARSAPPLGAQLQGIKRKRREGTTPVAVPAAAPRATEREWLDEEMDDWRDDVAGGWS